MLRRHCGLSAAEVDALPWWEYRNLIDGINVEFTPPDSEDDPDDWTTDIRPEDTVFSAEEFGLKVHSV